MNSSLSPFCDPGHRRPAVQLPLSQRAQSKKVQTNRASQVKTRWRYKSTSLWLAFTFFLVLGGQLSVSWAQNAPAPDTKANLVLFDFGDANDKQIRDAAIARFNKRYPNVTVTDQFTPISSWSDYLNKLVTQIASGKVPDLIHIATEGFELAVRRNLVIPLNELGSEASSKDLLSDVDPALVKGFTADGKLYLVPVAWNNMMIYYNTKVFSEAGIARPSNDWTWDDFLAIAKRLTSGEGPAKRFGFGIPYFNFGLTPFWYSNDTAVLRNDLKQSNLTDPKFLESLKFVHGLVRESAVSPDPANTDPNAVFQLFTAGKIAMTGGGHWPMQFFKANNFNDFDIVPWPKNKAQKTVFGADGWGISTKTKQKAIAWEMIKELTAAESQQQAAGLGVAIPARRSVAESKEFLAQPEHAALFYESLHYASPVQAPANYAEVERILMQHFGQVMADEVKPEEALKATNEELSEAMQQQAAEAQ